MPNNEIQHLLQAVAQGRISVEEALENKQFQTLQQHAENTEKRTETHSIQDTLCGLSLDTQRQARTGLGEVVFAPNKSPAQLISAVEHLHSHAPVLVTRLNPEQQTLLQTHFPKGHTFPEARLFSLGRPLPVASTAQAWPNAGKAIVISAGGSDRPVALEAFGTLAFWGIEAGFIADVGVAGLHRLSPHVPALQAAQIIIAVAGMEGALPGVVAGFVHCPVLAVPTSIGYGVGEKGRAALSSMLCSCVPGIAVCNIDNGFGAAAFATKMLLNTIK